MCRDIWRDSTSVCARTIPRRPLATPRLETAATAGGPYHDIYAPGSKFGRLRGVANISEEWVSCRVALVSCLVAGGNSSRGGGE